MEPVPKILSERSSPARREPEGWWSSGLTWVGWAEGREAWLDVKGDCVELLHLQGPWKMWVWGGMSNFHTPGVVLLPCLSPSSPAPTSSTVQGWSPDTPRCGSQELRSLPEQTGLKPFKHFRSKNFKLFCVKYVVSQDWEFIFSFVYCVLQKRWYSP